MALYSKICIICNSEFKTMRISSVYCGKVCANRSRKLPQKMKQSLIQRASQFTFSTLEQMGMERTARGYTPDGATVDNPLGKDAALLMAEALRIKAERDAKAKEMGIRDNAPLANIAKDNIDFINTTDPALGDSTGFKTKQEVQNDNISISNDSVSHAPVDRESESCNGSDDSIPVVSSSSNDSRPTKGIRKIGGLK